MLTGKDAATGKPRSRWIGAAWTAFNFIPISKVEKIAKDVRVGHLATRAITKRTGETAAKKARKQSYARSKGVKKGKATKSTKSAKKVKRQTHHVKPKAKAPLKNGPYIRNGKPYGRPTLVGKKKLKFEKAVYNKSVGKDGILRDSNTGEVIDWKPGQPRKGKVDFGHVGGKTYKDKFLAYKNRKITFANCKNKLATRENATTKRFFLSLELVSV